MLEQVKILILSSGQLSRAQDSCQPRKISENLFFQNRYLSYSFEHHFIFMKSITYEDFSIKTISSDYPA